MKADIIIISGQSNAVGVGHVECLSAHFRKERIQKWLDGYENIKINYFSHDKKSGGFVKTTVGCSEVTKYTFGPEVGIAEALDQRFPGKEFFIVKCAYGGMSMHTDFLSPSGGPQYDPLAFADQKRNIVEDYADGVPIRPGWAYNELVKILGESVKYLRDNGYDPEVRAFCWMQGENDACTPEYTAQYIRVYDAMLKDLAAAFPGLFDNCTYIDAGISEFWPLCKEINAAKKAYAEEAENRVYIDTIAEGFTTNNEPFGEPDIYHYDSDCMIKLGHLYANAIRF